MSAFPGDLLPLADTLPQMPPAAQTSRPPLKPALSLQDSRKAQKEASAKRAEQLGLAAGLDSSSGDDSNSTSDLESDSSTYKPRNPKSTSGESTDMLTPLPEDARQSVHARVAASSSAWHRRSSSSSSPTMGLSELMSSSDGYFSPVHSETSSTSKASSRWHHQLSSTDSSYTTPTSISGSACDSVGTGTRSPRVRNTGGVLAPHGTFTSRVAPGSPSHVYLPALPSPSGASDRSRSSQSSRSSRPQSPRQAAAPVLDQPAFSPEEFKSLTRAARKGDQLAMLRLGWIHRSGEQRHALGSVENVWGPIQLPSSSSFRSNQSSVSARSGSSSGSRPTLDRPPLPARESKGSDLFADAARMTLHSNAKNNRATKSPVEPSVPALSPRKTTHPRETKQSDA